VANIITVTVRVKDTTTAALKDLTATAAKSGQQAGRGFSSGFAKSMGSGVTGALFGGHGSSVLSTSQTAGQQAGLGFTRGLLQKFQQNMGSGLLSGLFGTSGGQKLFGSAGSTVVQSATMQGNAVGQGLAGGLNRSLNKASQQANSTLGTLLSGTGTASTNATTAGQQIGKSYSRGFLGSVTRALSNFRLPSLGGGSGGSGGGGGGKAGSAATNLAGGALPGIMGIGAGKASLVGVGASILGAVPAVAAIGAGLGVIAGAFMVLDKTSKSFAASLASLGKTAETVLTAAVQPLAGPLTQAMAQLGGFLKQIGPELKDMFAAAVPLVKPLVSGIEQLVSGLLPGLVAILHAAGPAFAAFAAVLGTLGKDVGSMFAGFAPVIKASALIFKALADVVSALFPIIGKLAATLASALAPAFAQFAALVKALLPALTPIISVLAAFAGAVVNDLIGVLSAVFTLLRDLAPSIKILGQAFSQVFTVLENSGVFALLGDALENLAPVLANLINALVTGLAPAFPAIIAAAAQLSTILVSLLSAGLTTLLNVITPVVAWLAKLAAGLVVWLQQSHLLLPVLAAVAIAIDPVGTAVVGLIAVIGLLATHWSQVWGEIKTLAADAWNFIWNGFGKYLLPLLGPAGMIALGAMELYQHWNTIWGEIKAVASDFYNWIWADFGEKLYTFFARTLPSYVQDFDNSVTRIINNIVAWLGGVPGRFIGAMASLGRDMLNLGSQVITDLWNGMKSGAAGITGWLGSFAHGVVNVFKTVWGWFSPSRVMYAGGRALMEGLAGGLNDHAHKAFNMAQAIASKVAGNLNPTGSGATIQALMQSMAASVGWTGAQWAALNNVEMREAGYNLNATNPSSGAYGLAQFINGPSEYAQYGGNVNTASGQITAMLRYIAQRYGSPSAAWAHEVNYGWYAGGGATSPGWAMVGERGRELVRLPGGATVMPHGQTEAMISGASGGAAAPAAVFEVAGSGNTLFDAFMLEWLRDKVRIKGGGNVQQAFGRH
jgi:phage-related protein